MADASLRARLEATQARRGELQRELVKELPLSPEDQQILAEVSELSLQVSTVEGRLTEAVRREDELIEHRARGWSLIKVIVSATITISAGVPGAMLAVVFAGLAKGSWAATVAGAALGLSAPLVVNGLRWRRGRARAERSRRVRAALTP